MFNCILNIEESLIFIVVKGLIFKFVIFKVDVLILIIIKLIKIKRIFLISFMVSFLNRFCVW